MIDSVGPHSSHPSHGSESSGLPAGEYRLVTTRGGRRGKRDESWLDWRVLLRSLRRRWLLATMLGLVAGAAAGVAAHSMIPAPYVARSEFYIKSFDDQLVFDTKESQAKFDTKKQSSMRLLLGRPVLTAALRDEKVAGVVERWMGGGENKTILADPIEWLAQNLVIANAGTEFFTLSLAAERPDEAALVVNAVANAFMTEVVMQEQGERQVRLKDLQGVADDVNTELSLKRRDLRALVDRTSTATTVMAEQKQSHLLEVHGKLREQLAQVELDLIRAQAFRNVRNQGKTADDLEIPDGVLDAYLVQEPEAQAAAAHVERMQEFVRRNEQTLGAGHPGIAEAKRKLAEAESAANQLRETLRPKIVAQLHQHSETQQALTDQQIDEQIRRFEAFKKELGDQLDSIKLRETETGILSLELEALDSDIARREGMAATLTEEIERRTYELKNAKLPIQIFQLAQVPSRRELKKRFTGTGAAGLGLFGFVVAAVVYLDSRGRRISSVEEVSNELSIRLIGSIPAMPRSAMVSSGSSARSRTRVVFWQNALKESIDAARTLLLSESDRVGHRVIMIGSACSSEGKTTLASHLATSLARAGRRVALVDCDFRRPSLDRVFALDGEMGVCELLRGEAEIDDVVQDGPVPGLSIVSAGEVDPAALEQLAGNGFAPILARLRAEYDFVLVDSSPVLPVCDALLVAQLTDGVMLAVRRDVSRMAQVAAAIHRFTALGIPVLGAVTIGLDDDPVGYGGYLAKRDHLRYGAGYAVSNN